MTLCQIMCSRSYPAKIFPSFATTCRICSYNTIYNIYLGHEQSGGFWTTVHIMPLSTKAIGYIMPTFVRSRYTTTKSCDLIPQTKGNHLDRGPYPTNRCCFARSQPCTTLLFQPYKSHSSIADEGINDETKGA